jgi:hypothetical protein
MSEIEEKDYYKELHNAARHYDVKMWAIPALALTLIGISVNGFLNQSLWSWKMSVLVFASGSINFILWLLFEKNYFFQLTIQELISRYEKGYSEFFESTDPVKVPKILPLYSVKPKEKQLLFALLEYNLSGGLDFKIKFAAKQRVSGWVSYSLLTYSVVSVTFVVWRIIFLFIYQ